MAVVTIKDGDGNPIGEIEPSGNIYIYNGVPLNITDIPDDFYDPWEDEYDRWDD